MDKREIAHVSIRNLAFAAAACFLMVPSVYAQQAQNGDRVEARAMLEKAATAVKADKAKALDMVDQGQGGSFYIKERDLFPFCFNIADGKIVVTQTKQALGKDIRTFKDKTGNAFGQEIYNAKEGQISEVHYHFARPGADQTPVPKVSFATRVGDLGCAVGYYP
ncbi:MAG TPA: cache domain-containing protein [Stellaceae bacterium]|jgi:signal transduction histidine kinase|nr:cache domain-containing protein [Stellaceae bacterium]